MSYVRSIHLHKNKDIFKVGDVPLKEFAAALGLPGAPKVKFVKKDTSIKNAQHVVPSMPDEDGTDGESSDEEETQIDQASAPSKVRIHTSSSQL